MTREQRIVLMGAVTGIVTMLLGTWLAYTLLPEPKDIATTGDRLAYAARWLALAAVPLFAMVVAVGNARFLSDAIDPTRGAEDRTMLINGRAADNTTQQFLLFAAGSLALAANLPPAQLKLVGAAAIVFTIARFVFWIGYRIHPLYRAPGFSSTAYLNLGLLLGALWLAISHGWS
jgi:hypothetical protein